jgi:hypothetical protein
MIMIKNAYFCVAKTKADNPNGNFWVVLLGTDRLEVLYVGLSTVLYYRYGRITIRVHTALPVLFPIPYVGLANFERDSTGPVTGIHGRTTGYTDSVCIKLS